MKRLLVLTALIAVIAALGAGPVWAQKFVHITDLHVTTLAGAVGEFDQDGRNFAKLRDAIIAQNPAFVIVTGDIVNTGLTEAGANDAANFTEFTNKLNKSGNTYYMKYAGGVYSIPVYYVPGNHDGRVRSQSPSAAQNLSAYDAYLGKPTGVPSGMGFSAIKYGDGVNNGDARDFYFATANMVFIGLYSGRDYTGDANFMNPESNGLKASQIAFIQAAKNAYPNRNIIIAMHHPAFNPNGNQAEFVGTDFKGDPFAGSFYGINDGTIGYLHSGSGSLKEKCDALGVKMVLAGHLHQNVVLNFDGGNGVNLKTAYSNGSWSQASSTQTNYVQTAEGFNGAYRIINVTSPTAFTVSSPNQVSSDLLLPAVKQSELPYYPYYVVQGVTNYFKAKIYGGINAILTLKFYVDGVLKTTINNPSMWPVIPYTIGSKSTSSTLKVEVTNSAGTTTATYPVVKIDGSDYFYNILYVNGTVGIKDPNSGQTVNFTLSEVYDNNGKRNARISISGQPTLSGIEQGKMYRVSNSCGLVVFATFLYAGAAELMIMPYISPSITIRDPKENATTGGEAVTVSTNYTGKNLPYQGSGNPNIGTAILNNMLRTITYNGVAANTESYNWVITGASGKKTMEVVIKDLLNCTSSKRVTVNYNSAIPFVAYAHVGTFGDSYKNVSIWADSDVRIQVDYCYEGIHYFNNGFLCPGSRQAEIDRYSECISRAAIQGCGIPTGSTAVYVADINKYNTGSFSSICGYGTITWKEIYESLARRLGKDATGKYRVWASASSVTRSPSDAILDAYAPVLAVTSPLANASVSSGTVNVSGTASDDYGLSKIEVSVNNGAYQLAAGKTNWSLNVALVPGSNLINCKATDLSGKTTIVSLRVACLVDNLFYDNFNDAVSNWTCVVGGPYAIASAADVNGQIALSISQTCKINYVGTSCYVQKEVGTYNGKIILEFDWTTMDAGYYTVSYGPSYANMTVTVNDVAVLSEALPIDSRAWSYSGVYLSGHFSKELTVNGIVKIYFSIGGTIYCNNCCSGVKPNLWVDNVIMTKSQPAVFTFDNGNANGWALSGLWHVTSYRSSSPSYSLVYNQESSHNYDVGANSGAAVWDVTLPSSSSVLEFDHCRWVEWWEDGYFDVSYVQISNNGGATWSTLAYWDALSDNINPWQHVSLGLGGYTGAVKIRFYFDTGDDYANGYEGWYIDNVAVKSSKDAIPAKLVEVRNTGVVRKSKPAVTQLLSCLPNPLTHFASISYQLASPAQTTIKVYNLTGQMVKTLVNECVRPGYHSVKWDGRDANGNKVAAGVYLYRMSAGDYTKTNKMTVLR